MEEMENRFRTSFMKMAASFTDPSKAEECFLKLNHMKDNNIFNTLELLLDELKYTNSQTTRVRYLFIFSFCFSLCLVCLCSSDFWCYCYHIPVCIRSCHVEYGRCFEALFG